MMQEVLRPCDIRRTPFSRYGSCVSLSRTPATSPQAGELGTAVYLRNHFGRGARRWDVFRLEFLEAASGGPVAVESAATPEALMLART